MEAAAAERPKSFLESALACLPSSALAGWKAAVEGRVSMTEAQALESLLAAPAWTTEEEEALRTREVLKFHPRCPGLAHCSNQSAQEVDRSHRRCSVDVAWPCSHLALMLPSSQLLRAAAIDIT